MINQTSTSSSMSKRHWVLKVTFDMSTEGCNSFWEAHSLIVKESGLDGAEIWNVEYKGDAPNGWPMIEVTFQSTEVAKLYTATYLGLDSVLDDEVDEYLSTSEYVPA